jgi:hypothetical protein
MLYFLDVHRRGKGVPGKVRIRAYWVLWYYMVFSFFLPCSPGWLRCKVFSVAGGRYETHLSVERCILIRAKQVARLGGYWGRAVPI